MNQTKDAETSEKFRGLFKVGGAATLIAGLFTITQGVINGAGVAYALIVLAHFPAHGCPIAYFCIKLTLNGKNKR